MQIDPKGTAPRRGKGRTHGSAHVRTRVMANQLSSDGGLTPLEVLIKTMRELLDDSNAIVVPAEGDAAVQASAIAERRRLKLMACEVAKDAAPYMHAKLQAVAIVSNPDDDLPQIENAQLSTAELFAQIMARGLPLDAIEH